MFTRIEAERFRAIKRIDLRLRPFQALVGPNASGKTTVLDVVELLGDLIRERGDVRAVVQKRSADFAKLVWLGEGDRFRLAVEAPIPPDVLGRVMDERRHLGIARYEIEIALDRERDEIGLDHETLWTLPESSVSKRPQRELFPAAFQGAKEIFLGNAKTRKALVKKVPGGNDNYYPDGRSAYQPSFRNGRRQAALANVPADAETFVVATWFRGLLERGIQNIQLDASALRRPSPPGLGQRFQPDGSNLPWIVSRLAERPDRFGRWLKHVRTSLVDVETIETVEREEDRKRYLVVRYANGARVPSWLLSDGTLRLLALTVLTYLDENDAVYLIEEPENGIHPRAIETVMESLRSIYDSQVLVATHSPVALNMLDAADVLCVAKTDEGAADIVSGDEHPALRDWKRGEPDLGVLLASGILS